MTVLGTIGRGAIWALGHFKLYLSTRHKAFFRLVLLWNLAGSVWVVDELLMGRNGDST